MMMMMMMMINNDLQPAGTPLTWFSPRGREKVMRLVSWLICSVLVTVRVCAKTSVRGRLRRFVGGFWAESRECPDDGRA
jgi:hypothetical protein